MAVGGKSLGVWRCWVALLGQPSRLVCFHVWIVGCQALEEVQKQSQSPHKVKSKPYARVEMLSTFSRCLAP